MKTYQYYPGCSMEGRASACPRSLLAVVGKLCVELREIPDWNCCGVACGLSVGDTQALTLAARNLALVESAGEGDLITPCSVCHHVLSRAKHQLDMYPDIRIRVGAALAGAGLRYRGSVQVRHLLDVLVEDVGERGIAERVTRRPENVRVAPYYGCQFFHRHSDKSAARRPGPLERLLSAVGAVPIEYPSRRRCCGGVQLRALPTRGSPGIADILQVAQQGGADCVVTGCPACHHNLVRHQGSTQDTYGIPAMPVLYVAQFLGLAMGLPASQLGLTRGAGTIIARRAEHVA